MENYIFVGCDCHDKTLVVKIALGREGAEGKRFGGNSAGRRRFIEDLKRRAEQAGGARVVVVYEASGSGFILHDELTQAGLVCHVLAPTRIERSSHQKRNKDDDRDADRLLDIVRAHYLAGTKMPAVWVPDARTRDDREIVRVRQDAKEKQAAVKTQIQMLLKRHGIEKREGLGRGWTKSYRRWLKALSGSDFAGWGMRTALSSLLRQLEFLEEEIEQLDQAMQELAECGRYKPIVDALLQEKGVGLTTALKYATEIGDFSRFRRGRQVGAFFGLVPCSHGSGATNDRKGHITRQGSPSARKMLCQAAWSRVQWDRREREVYSRLVTKNPKRKKVALVACMRRLAVQLWHVGVQAQRAAQQQLP